MSDVSQLNNLDLNELQRKLDNDQSRISLMKNQVSRNDPALHRDIDEIFRKPLPFY